MNNRILLKTQKNELFEIMKDLGFNPFEFRWIETRSDFDPNKTISRLVHDGTDFFYSFEMQGEAHLSVFCPAPHSYVGTDYPGTWNIQKSCFSKWLKNLKKEINEPDLWNSYSSNETNAGDSDHKTYVTAEPSSQSPAPDQITSRIDSLFEEKNTIERPRTSVQTQPQIKRYYGKV